MGYADAGADMRWYVVSTRPRQERRAERNLLAWNVDTFSPRLKGGGARPGAANGPLFPGYIFARFDAAVMLNKIRFTRGVNEVVCFGGRAAPVEDDVIEIIRRRQDEDGNVLIGERPRDAAPPPAAAGGALKSFAAMFERPHGERERVDVLLATVCGRGCPDAEPGPRARTRERARTSAGGAPLKRR